MEVKTETVRMFFVFAVFHYSIPKKHRYSFDCGEVLGVDLQTRLSTMTTLWEKLKVLHKKAVSAAKLPAAGVSQL